MAFRLTLPLYISHVLFLASAQDSVCVGGEGQNCQPTYTPNQAELDIADTVNLLQVGSPVAISSGSDLQPGENAVVELGDAQSTCPHGFSPILSEAACWAAMDRLADPPGCKYGQGCRFDHWDWDADDYDYYGGVETASEFPPGCYYHKPDEITWFNEHPTGKTDEQSQSYCAKDFDVTNAKLLFLGDSDIDYWRNTNIDFPGSFNIGIGGSTCKQWVKKVDWVVRNFQPETVVLVCGENDLPSDSAMTTFKNFEKIVKTFLDRGTRVLVLGTKPEPGSHKDKLHNKYNEYDSYIRKFVEINSQSEGASPFVFVDVNPSFLEIGNPKSLYDNDELHMSSEGYGNWVTWTKKALDDMDSNQLGCWLWQNGRCVEPGAFLGDSGNSCPSGSEKIVDEAACKAASGAIDIQASDTCKGSCGNPGWKTSAFKAWKKKRCANANCKGCSPCRLPNYNGPETDAAWPSGCYYCSDVDDCADGTWFNRHGTGSANGNAKPYCVKT